MGKTELPPGPLTAGLGLTVDAQARLRAKLERLGVRPMPYPFASAMAVISDLDSANLERHRAYVEGFRRFGLDFGDSTWLRWTNVKRTDRASGLGFFAHDFSLGLERSAASLRDTRTFFETLAGFHAGDIDHFHSLLRDGPRVIVLDAAVGGSPDVHVPPLQEGGPWRSEDLYLFGLLVDGECEGAVIVERDGRETANLAPHSPPVAGKTLLTLALDAEKSAEPRRFGDIDFARLKGPSKAGRVVLLSCHGELLLAKVAELRRFGVEMSLVTEHACLHFRNPSRAAMQDAELAEWLADPQGPLRAVWGEARDDKGLIVSTDADDPQSICRVLPELFDLGLRFLVPAASAGPGGFDPLQLISPTPTRSGGGGYWARRCMPRPLPEEDKAVEGRTDLRTFAGRVRRILHDAAAAPGLAWPLYTHLGVIAPDPGRQGAGETPEPYLEEGAMAALRDAAFGIVGKEPRVWLTRPSVLYDYCLMLRGIGDHVRRGANWIDIDSWIDPALGRPLPCSPAQLYGLTFHVEDAAAAVIRLDGRRLQRISRNGADQNGRQSVTILESEIRSILFDSLNPLANAPGEAAIDGTCGWDGEALEIDGAVTIPLHGWSAPGSQALAIRAEGGFGLRLTTNDGASFYFGQARWAAPGADDATYIFRQGDEREFVAPFHDLAWRAGAGGGAAPSHPLASVTLTGEARFQAVEFLRPRATNRPRDSFCVIGQVAVFEKGQMVDLDGRLAMVDQRGWFCFPEVPAGIYRLGSNGACDRRGPLVEVGSDIFNLMLDRAP